MRPFSRNDEHSRVILRFDCMMFQLREGQPTDRTDWIDSIINRRLYTKSQNIHLMSGFPIGRIGRAVIPINQKYFHQESTRSRFPFRAPHLTTAESSSIEIITKSPTHKHTHTHTHTARWILRTGALVSVCLRGQQSRSRGYLHSRVRKWDNKTNGTHIWVPHHQVASQVFRKIDAKVTK